MQLVEDIITDIVCSEVWDKEQAANPEIAVSTARMEALLNAARQYVPEDLMCELERAIYQYAGAYDRVSLLNGLHAADALRDVTTHPSGYTDVIARKLSVASTESGRQNRFNNHFSVSTLSKNEEAFK